MSRKYVYQRKTDRLNRSMENLLDGASDADPYKLLAAAIMACVIVSLVFKKDDRQFPTDDDMDQMCIWYEDQYGKDV